MRRNAFSFSNLRFCGLTPIRAVVFLGLSSLASLLEGFSMVMFLPLIEFLEKGINSATLDNAGIWRAITIAFSLLNLPVNLVTLLSALMFLIFMRILFMYARQVYSSWLTQTVQHTIRVSMVDVSLHADYSLFDRTTTGTIINKITTETERFGQSFHGLISMLANGIVVFGFFVIFLWVSPSMTLLTVTFIAMAVAITLFYVRHIKDLSRSTTSNNISLSNIIVERFSLIRLIKITSAEERESRNIAGTSLSLRNFQFNIAKLMARIDLIMEPVVVCCGLLIIYAAVTFLHLKIAVIGLFMLSLLRLLPISKELLKSRQTYLSGTGSWETILSGLNEARAKREIQGGSKIFGNLTKEIRFEQVTFSYPNSSSAALRDINISFPAGRVTALVGPSGAGKTTLADLLPLLRRPQEGVISFDGIPSEHFDLPSLRRGIAFVSQESAILNDTVRANLLFVKSDATDEQIDQALSKAKASDFVRALPQGLNTILGERGTRLSGGQKQRLSLSRAWLQNAPLLILDEPTSALDSETERDIQNTINALRSTGEKTIIIIAHRMSTIREADKIIVLNEGRITQEGTHADLVAHPEWYAMVDALQKT